MRRLVSFGLATILLASLFVLPARAASVSMVTYWKTAVNNTSTPITLTTATTSGDQLYALIYTQASACVTLTPAAGWTQLADSGCVSTKHRLTIFVHVATGETSDTVLSSLSAAAYQNEIIAETTGANTSALDTSAFGAMPASTTPATPNINTTQNGDLIFALWGTATNAATASTITAGWSQIDNNNGVYQSAGYQSQTTAGAVTGPTVTHASAPSSGVVGTIAIAPAGSTLYNGMSATFAGGPHASTVVSVSSVAVAPYAPSYIYQGPDSGGGGGNDNGGTAMINGAMMSAANIRYVEEAGGMNGSFDPSGSGFCGTNNQYCISISYQKFNTFVCPTTQGSSAIYSDAEGLYNSGTGSDPFWLHTATPYSHTNRMTQGVSSSCTYNTTDIEVNPSTPQVTTYWNNEYFKNASYINSRTWFGVRFDNSSYPGSTASVEYPVGNWSQYQTYIQALASRYASFSPQTLGINAGGCGGSNCRNDTGYSTVRSFAAHNHIVNDVDDWCAANPGTFLFTQFERPMTSTGTSGAVLLGNNLPFIIDSVAEWQNTTGCTNMDQVFLEQNYGTSGLDNPYIRNLNKAVAMLLQPNDYDGSKNHRAVLEQSYPICSGGGPGCTNQITVLPEYGLNFVPTTTFGKWTETSGGDGNGCHTGDAGGAADLAVMCTGTDVNGVTGAVYGRAGECYKFGVDWGPCFVLINQSSGTVTIPDTACSSHGGLACSAYGHILQPIGTGPETCFEDLGTNLGTSSATCNTGQTLTPAANGGQSAFGEATEPSPLTLAGAPSSSTVMSAYSSVILLKN